ncbi:MAG: HEAT repeat domain-containing protein [Ilumatobacteraceae bacterium]
MNDPAGASPRRAVALAGHLGDLELARGAMSDPDPAIRATALGAMRRLELLTPDDLRSALTDRDPEVRRRAAQLAATERSVDLTATLDDPDTLVAEMAAWACGEHEQVPEATFTRLVELATDHCDPLVREACIAALGAIGDERARDAVLAGTRDKPAIRRRAVIALVAFDGPEVEEALRRALDDKDWQVREAADELLREI